jgi:photosystem II stability/assembly factor-like uncharacterized protein
MSKRLLVATRKGLFTYQRSGGKPGWKITHTAFLGDHVPMVLPDARDGSCYAALEHGHFGTKLHRAPDGTTWEEAAVPTYPERPADSDDVDPFTQTPREWKLRKIWSLEAGSASQPGLLWCGTIPGGLFRSEDSGKSWDLVGSLWNHELRKKWFGGGAEHPGIHSICVDPNNPQRLILGVSCGGVWVSDNLGDTWDCRAEGMFAEYMPPDQRGDGFIQDPHRIVQCRARPESLWAQHHNGVFRTTDGCASWQEIQVPPSVFGFAVAVHPNDPQTAWTVPAIKDEKRIPVDGKVVVARTRDGGQNFEVLRNGLPQERAYDLTYRHGLDIDETGRELAFGTTTGSLWWSEDQGDHWQNLSTHLPPIYCVRFAKPA